MKTLLMALALTAAAHAQVTLTTLDGTPVGMTYSFGSLAQGASTTVLFRVANAGSSAVTVVAPVVNGAGFSLNAASSCTIPAASSGANCPPLAVTFTAGPPATYNANLQFGLSSGAIVSVILIGISVPGPTLSVQPPCTLAPGGSIDFGALQNTVQQVCNLTVSNPNAQPFAISTLGVTGDFQGAQLPAAPFALAPNQAATFSIEVTPACGKTSLSGALRINGQTYAIAGSGFDPDMPQPSLNFDASSFGSNEQHTLTMSLPAAYPCSASGIVSLSLTPASGTVDGDSTIVFLQGSVLSLPFTVAPNTTQISIEGQPGAAFNTGTTAGTLTFTVTKINQKIAGGTPSASFPIAPAPIAIEAATASNQRLGDLDVQVIGFDNTYSAGAMSFTFFDANGKQIGSPVSADFTEDFKNFFGGQHNGSSFLMRVSFPVQGEQAEVASVQAALTNSAGQAKTDSLAFH